MTQLISFTESFTQKSFLTYSQRRIDKILDYAARQRNKSKFDKNRDFQRLTLNEKNWVERRMKGPQRSWERWNGEIEVWEPWGFLGSPINKWSREKSK